MIVACLAFAHADLPEVFRYEDADTAQSHYMMGEPGVAVEGGWTFEAPGGQAYQLSYTADEMGFQVLLPIFLSSALGRRALMRKNTLTRLSFMSSVSLATLGHV